jgi:hypothetical protein
MAQLVNFRAEVVGSPLYISASGGYARNAELLIQAGAMIELEGGHWGTPLMGACESGHLQTVELLVRRGAMLAYLNENGSVVSGLVLAKHHPNVVRWLLVLRYTEQQKLSNTLDGSSVGIVITPWAGVQRVEVFRPWAYQDSLFDHLLEQEAFRRRYFGRVYRSIE